MQTMETTTRDLSTSTMVGQTLPSLECKHHLRYSVLVNQVPHLLLLVVSKQGKLKSSSKTSNVQ